VLDLHAPHRGPALCLNASRAAITALELGVPAQTIRDGISGYRGVSRRMELRHSRNGVLMLDDYAHNPAQITELARAARLLPRPPADRGVRATPAPPHRNVHRRVRASARHV
jgi:UDP-N-acetylmuramate-alanine ligase